MIDSVKCGAATGYDKARIRIMVGNNTEDIIQLAKDNNAAVGHVMLICLLRMRSDEAFSYLPRLLQCISTYP